MSQSPIPEGKDTSEQTQVDETHTESTEADETTAGPAEENDPGNDNPATTAAVE